MDFVENRNCAQNLAYEVAREAAEIITLDSYFYISLKRRKFDQKLKNFIFSLNFRQFLLRY